MKFNSRENQEKANFESTKVIQAKIGNTAKMLKMFTKDLYKHPLQTAIQEYINNAKDAHIMVGKDTSSIEITAPTIANQSIVIRDYGPGLSPDDIVDIFANIAVSNKDESDLFIGGFGIGSKSWFAVNTSFIVISVFEKTKTYYSVKFDEKKGIFIEVDLEEDTNEPNGVEVHLPLANANQIMDAHKSIFRAVEFWDKKPVLNNLEVSFYPTLEENEDYTLISYNPEGDGKLFVTLGRTQYSIKDIPCYFGITSLAKHYSIAIHFKVGEMKLKNVQEVGPDREAFASVCSNAIQEKVKEVHQIIVKKMVDKLEASESPEEICDLLSHPLVSQSTKSVDKTISERTKVHFRQTHSKSMGINRMPMSIKGWSVDFVIVEGVVSAAETYLAKTVRVPYIMILDEADAPLTAKRLAISNFCKISSSRPTQRDSVYSGVYVVEDGVLSDEEIDGLKKYFIIEKFSEVKIEKEKIEKVKVQRPKDEINLVKINWERAYHSNIKVKVSELNKENCFFYSKKQFDDLKIEWSDMFKYYSKLGLKVFVVSESNSSLFKTLGFKNFSIEDAEAKILQIETLRKEKLKQEAIEANIAERYSKTSMKRFFFQKFYSRYNQDYADKILTLNHPFFAKIKELGDISDYNQIENEKRKYNEIFAEIEIPQDLTLIEDFKILESKYPLIFNNIFSYGSERYFDELKFLVENMMK